MKVLSHLPLGSFVVRKSQSSPQNFALSTKDNNGKIVHVLIMDNGTGYYLEVQPAWHYCATQ